MADQTKNNISVESVDARAPSNSSPPQSAPPGTVAAAASAKPTPSSAPRTAESQMMRVSSYCCYDQLLCCSSRFLLQNYANFNCSGALMRIMHAKDNGGWLDFSDEVLSTLKSSFVERKPVIDVEIGDSKYLFDFPRMLQMDLESGSQRSIAWIDENGNCFFPRMVITPEDDNHEKEEILKLRIGIQVGESKNKRKNIDGMENEVVEVIEVDPLRPEQREMDASKRLCLRVANVGLRGWPNTKLLIESKETNYSVYKKAFISGMKQVDPGVTITAIHEWRWLEDRVQRARAMVFTTQFDTMKALRGRSNMVYAWHGASAKNIESIMAHGFGAPTRVSEADSYGVGVYLSPFDLPHIGASLSEVDENGERHIMLCSVILGNSEPLKAGSSQSAASNANFDTGVDDPKDPKWYVIWTSIMNSHIMPECIVSFRSSDSGQDKLQRRATLAQHAQVVKKLFFKKNSLLPPAIMREAEILYKAVMAGNMSKSGFIRQLQCIVGK